MVENIFEELDAPGEWFYRKSTGQLFFLPPGGTDLGSATIELASQDELIKFIGTASSKVKHITFKGIQFTHTHRTLFSDPFGKKPYEPMLRGDWSIVRAGVIFMENAENIRIEHCFFNQIGGNGIFLSGYNRKNLIFNNNFQHTGASCVVLFGWKSSNWCPANSFSVAGPCDNFTDAGPKTDEHPAFNLIDNNTMHNLGVFEKQTAGVNISMAQFDTVRHNTIYVMPRAGINFTDGCYGGHVIENNWVYESVLETGDHGPFNAWGRDRIARKGEAGDPKYAKLDAQYTTIIRNNRFEGKVPNFGIDLDDQASNYNQYNNLCIGVGLKLQWNRFNTYTNNIVVGGGVGDISTVWKNSHHYFARNIISGTVVYSLNKSQTPAGIKAVVDMLDSNCLWSDGVDPKISEMWNRDVFLFTWSEWLTAGLDAYSVVADPLFIDPKNGDYRVKEGSPALKLGFKNFDMNNFGTRVVNYKPEIPTNSIDKLKNAEVIPYRISYRAGQFHISSKEAYQVIVLTASGRAVKVYKGEGDSRFECNSQTLSSGIYVAVIQIKNHMLKKRIFVN